jgi:predicted double-glycine peptidase
MEGANTADNGTSREDLTRFTNEHGVHAENHENLTLDDIQKSLNKKNPVMVEMQAWSVPQATDYSNVWSAGHYEVVVGMDRERVYVMDPMILGGRGYIPLQEFLQRWHDVNGEGKHVFHAGILFSGKKDPTPAWQHVP